MQQSLKTVRGPCVCVYVCVCVYCDVFHICFSNPSDTDTLPSHEEGLFPFIQQCSEVTDAINTEQNRGSR